MGSYAQDNNNSYPTPDIWCDLLQKPYPYIQEISVCLGALEAGNKEKSHYAINPNCEPNSPGDIVLLFETKGGWNQHGGPELLTTENHIGKGSNILFNNFYLKFVKTEELQTLKWKP